MSQRYTYTGREASQAGAPMYYRYRRYDAAVGRFVLRDPAGYENNDAGNLYDYVYSSSIQYVDPYGLWTLSGCRTYGVSAGVNAYVGLGKSFGIDITMKTCHCMDPQAGKRPNDYKETNINIYFEIGTGFGASVDVWGFKFGAYVKGPQLKLVDFNLDLVKTCCAASSRVDISKKVSARIGLEGGFGEYLGGAAGYWFEGGVEFKITGVASSGVAKAEFYIDRYPIVQANMGLFKTKHFTDGYKRMYHYPVEAIW